MTLKNVLRPRKRNNPCRLSSGSRIEFWEESRDSAGRAGLVVFRRHKHLLPLHLGALPPRHDPFQGWRAIRFCRRRTRKPTAIFFADLMQVVAETIFHCYSHAENAPIAWDGEDQTYIGTTYDTWDLIREPV